MQTVTSKDGTRIAYDKQGSGPAIIIVSGATATKAAEAPLASLLAPNFTVYAYDRRGRVDSGDTLPFAVEREFEDIAAIIDLAGGSASLYSISSGAILALRAVASGLPVSKLALWEPPFSVDENGRQYHLEYRKQLDKLIAEGRRGDALELFMTRVGTPAQFIAQARQSPWWPQGEALAHTLAYDAAAMGDSLVPAEEAAGVTIPTLILDGGPSDPFFHAAAQALLAVMPNAKIKSLDGQTHNVDPQLMAPVLTEFFKG